MSYLLDTNVLSETRKRQQNPGLRDWITVTPVEQMHISVLTVGEIWRGITLLRLRADQRQAAMFESWLRDVVRQFGERIVPISVTIAERWGRQNPAHSTPTIDALIAATALAHDWVVVTRNVKDFAPTDVSVLNPFSG